MPPRSMASCACRSSMHRTHGGEVESFCKKVIAHERCDCLRWKLRYVENEANFSNLPAAYLVGRGYQSSWRERFGSVGQSAQALWKLHSENIHPYFLWWVLPVILVHWWRSRATNRVQADGSVHPEIQDPVNELAEPGAGECLCFRPCAYAA